ncbi:MAG: MnmC family methyltransferase [Campylobacterota bacterium]|nr:MnmC family methyltransferase [Campylobacterota bacterium]
MSTKDGSNTLYSKQYEQHFHSVKDGAIFEALHKHIFPSLQHHQKKKQLNILDICFGLGYNTFSTIDYIIRNNLDLKVCFYSPELDEELIQSLGDFQYPKEFDHIKPIIDKLVTSGYYEDEQFTIQLHIGDARKYIQTLDNIDVVYQDAFSSEVNKELWTKQYFADIKKILSRDAVITTYSIATPIRLGMSENNLFIFERVLPNNRKSTLAFTQKHSYDGYIDMDLKKQRNPSANALED